MVDQSDLRACATELTAIFKPFVERVSDLEWTSEDGVLGLIHLCALRRQFDALQVLRSMAEAGTCDKGVALLRTACEELIWLTYLNTLERADAEELVLSKSLIDINKTVTAQMRYAGETDMAAWGFTPEWLVATRKRSDEAAKRVAAIGAKLGWPKNSRPFPTAKFMADESNLTEFYDVIYHATSRNVHFSPSELLRSAWGQGRRVQVGSPMLSRYWEAFVLFWGWRLFMLTAHAVTEAFEHAGRSLGEIDNSERILELTVEMGRHGKVPIVTSEEMNLHDNETERAGLFERKSRP